MHFYSGSATGSPLQWLRCFLLRNYLLSFRNNWHFSQLPLRFSAIPVWNNAFRAFDMPPLSRWWFTSRTVCFANIRKNLLPGLRLFPEPSTPCFFLIISNSLRSHLYDQATSIVRIIICIAACIIWKRNRTGSPTKAFLLGRELINIILSALSVLWFSIRVVSLKLKIWIISQTRQMLQIKLELEIICRLVWLSIDLPVAISSFRLPSGDVDI